MVYHPRMIVQRETCLSVIENKTGLFLRGRYRSTSFKSFHNHRNVAIFAVSCTPDYQHVVVAIVLPRTQFYPIRCMEMSRRWSPRVRRSL